MCQKEINLNLKKYKLEQNGIELFSGFAHKDKIKINNFFKKKLFEIIQVKNKYNISLYHKWYKRENINHEKIMNATNRHFYPPNNIKEIFFSKKKSFYRNLIKLIGNHKLHDEGLGWISFRLIRPHKYEDGYPLSKKIWGPGGKIYSVIFNINKVDKYNSLGFVINSHKKKYPKKIQSSSKFCKSEFRFNGNLKKIKIDRFHINENECLIFHPGMLHCEEADIRSKISRFSIEIRFKKIEK